MMDYQPLDLSALCNAGHEALGHNELPPTGRLQLRGLPFLVGPGGMQATARHFIVLDGASRPVTIPVGHAAHSVIFAHRLLESDVLEGGLPGKTVAEYVFRLSGGREVRVPVRERFEIGALGDTFAGMGQPYLAVSDRNDYLLPRHQGPWGEAGRRQTEAARGNPTGYYLWAWKAPHPDVTLESIQVVPKGPRFLLAAVTLGHVDEHPFVRQGKREARILLSRPEDAEKPFDLSVEVDRGFATYVYPLPRSSEDEFLDSPLKGFGEAPSARSSPAYVEVAAIPSATVTVKSGDEELGKVRWGDVEDRGEASTSRVRIELLDRGRNWVHVTVLDEGTGRPVPCRVHFRSPEGIPYQPHGHHNHVNSGMGTWHMDVGGDVRLGQATYAYIYSPSPAWRSCRRGVWSHRPIAPGAPAAG